MNQTEAKERLANLGAVITNDHFVYTSGRHGSAYVAKDTLSPHPNEIRLFGRAIAENFLQSGIEVVAGPAVASIPLVQWTAHWLGELGGREILAVYAEQREEVVCAALDEPLKIGANITLMRGQKLIKRISGFVLNRGYDKLVKGKRVLVVDDILTTGGSAKSVVDAVRNAGGEPVAVAAICNRGGVTPDKVGNVQEVFAVLDVTLESWAADANEPCPLCAAGKPINTTFGHGKQFLEALAARK